MLDLEKDEFVKVTNNDCSECKKGKYVQFVRFDYYGWPDEKPEHRGVYIFKNNKHKRIELFYGEFELNNVRVVTPKYVN
ncbi:hypothetical protein [Bacillus pretiosus]